jgi:hypothetical protein
MPLKKTGESAHESKKMMNAGKAKIQTLSLSSGAKAAIFEIVPKVREK